METAVMIILAIVMYGAAFYLLIRDMIKIPKELKIYMVVVLLMIIGNTLMLQLFYRDNSMIANIKRVILLSLMGPIAYMDFKETRIPNQFIILGLVCRVVLIPVELLFSAKLFFPAILSEVIAAAALFLAAALCRLCIKNAIGAGDMKLFLIMGLFLGLDGIWSAILLSLLISFFIAVFLLLSKKKTKKDSIAFGPALAIGTYLSIFFTGL